VTLKSDGGIMSRSAKILTAFAILGSVLYFWESRSSDQRIDLTDGKPTLAVRDDRDSRVAAAAVFYRKTAFVDGLIVRYKKLSGAKPIPELVPAGCRVVVLKYNDGFSCVVSLLQTRGGDLEKILQATMADILLLSDIEEMISAHSSASSKAQADSPADRVARIEAHGIKSIQEMMTFTAEALKGSCGLPLAVPALECSSPPNQLIEPK
jgi:hypothetical protein